MSELEESLRAARVLDEEDRVKMWPSRKQRERQLDVLRYLASKIPPEVDHSEMQVNAIIKQWHTFQDHALLRREMVDAGLVMRDADGSKYRRA